MPALLGRKLGMTQVFQEDGRLERVTVVEAGPCPVLAIRTSERDGYEAVQLGFGEVKEKRLTKAQLGHLKKADAPPVKHLREFRDEAGELQVGDKVTVEAFEKGQRVKVAGVSKGKGFQGTVKRHNFSRGPVSHGSHNIRAPGSIGASATPSRVFKGLRGPGRMGGRGGHHPAMGASATPSRVFKGLRGPGRMGGRRVTQRGLSVARVIPEENLLLVRGAVP